MVDQLSQMCPDLTDETKEEFREYWRSLSEGERDDLALPVLECLEPGMNDFAERVRAARRWLDANRDLPDRAERTAMFDIFAAEELQ
jgi:hypothetical protein